MKFHQYRPQIWESEPLDGQYQRLRVYRHHVKDSQATYYVLCGVWRDSVMTKIARCETREDCMEMAEELA